MQVRRQIIKKDVELELLYRYVVEDECNLESLEPGADNTGLERGQRRIELRFRCESEWGAGSGEGSVLRLTKVQRRADRGHIFLTQK